MSHSLKLQLCPCGSSLDYSSCCQPYHLAQKLPTSAEKLMRSRYSAYVFKLTTYLKDTWHQTTCPDLDNLIVEPIKWVELTINRSWPSQQENEAFVEFTAKYKINGKAEKMHETSRFIFENGQWLYIDGNLT